MQEAIEKGFKLTMADPKIFKETVNIISDLLTEVNIKVKIDILELVSMDPANVAMVIFRMSGSAFTEYNVKQEQTIGLNLSNLKQIIRRSKSDDILALELEEGRLKISMKGNSDRTFRLPLIELDEKEQKIPELKFPVKIECNSSVLSEAVEDANTVAESVAFNAEPNKFSITAQGELSGVNIEIPKDDNTRITVEGNSKVESKYSIEYLMKMISGSKLSEKAIVQYNKDYPLMLQFKEDLFELIFVLAPRVDND